MKTPKMTMLNLRKRASVFRAMLLLCFLWSGNQAIQAQQELFAVQNSTIISINPTTGASTLLMTIDPTLGPVNRLTYHAGNDVFYAYGRGGSTQRSTLLEISICDSTVEVIDTIETVINGTTFYAFPSEGLDYDPNTNTLFATFGTVTGSANSNRLCTIDPVTAVATYLGNITHSGTVVVDNEFDIIEFANTNNPTSDLIGYDLTPSVADAFYDIDYVNPNAGNSAFLSNPTGLPTTMSALAFNEDDNLLYSIRNGVLVTVDVSSDPTVFTPVTPVTNTVIRGLEWGPSCCPYEIATVEETCENLDCLCCGTPKICIPFNVKNTIQAGMIGIDFCVEYDNAFLNPTGNVQIGDVVLDGSVDADYAINYALTPGELHVSIFYDPSAPATAEFIGSGEIACVEFELLPSYTSGTTLELTVCEVIEGFQTSVEFECADDGSFTLLDDDTLAGRVIFWQDNSRPLRYDVSNPTDYLVTNISGTDNACAVTNPNVATTDIDGNFLYDINNGPSVQITRDINGNLGSAAPCPGPSGVMPIINGMDAYWTSLVTTLNGSYVPNVYQIISMDVNMDGFVSANDITHIQNRTIGNICEYPQAWNYPSPTQNSLDWRFIDSVTVDTDPIYTVSSSYPSDDNTGYSRYNVPDVPFCLEVPVEQNGTFCTIIPDQTYNGMLLGDVNGTWDGNTPNVVIKANDEVIFALDEATKDANCVISIPVYYSSTSNLMAMDFNLDYDETRLTLIDVVESNTVSGQVSMAYNDLNNESLLLTSYSTTSGGISLIDPVYYVQFESIDDQVNDSDLGAIASYFNGNSSISTIDGSNADCSTIGTASIETADALNITVSPNPFSTEVNIELGDYAGTDGTIELFNIQGQRVLESTFNSNEKNVQLDSKNLARGVYLLHVNGRATSKLIKQ